MAEDRASIDGSTILDNVDERQVEFAAEVGGDRYDFAVRYAVLEALGGVRLGEDDDVVVLFGRFRDEVAQAAAVALARGPGIGAPIAIDEGDIG